MKKLPSLPPETMSMVGLTLFQQLHNLARFAFAQTDPAGVRDVDIVGMDYLWKVALRANNTGEEKVFEFCSFNARHLTYIFVIAIFRYQHVSYSIYQSVLYE